MTKSLSEICKLTGLKFGEASEGAHVSASQHEPTGYWIKDGKTALALEPYADHMEPKVGQRVKRLANAYRESERAKKEREKAKAEAQKQAQIEAQKRADDQIRQRIKRANPTATPEQIEAILPKVREAEMIKRTLEDKPAVRNSRWEFPEDHVRVKAEPQPQSQPDVYDAEFVEIGGVAGLLGDGSDYNPDEVL